MTILKATTLARFLQCWQWKNAVGTSSNTQAGNCRLQWLYTTKWQFIFNYY